MEAIATRTGISRLAAVQEKATRAELKFMFLTIVW